MLLGKLHENNAKVQLALRMFLLGRREKGMGEKGMAQKVPKTLKKSKFWKIDILAWMRKTRGLKHKDVKKYQTSQKIKNVPNYPI